MHNKPSHNNITPTRSLIHGDWFVLLCLFISVTHIIFQWYEVFMAVPLFFVIIRKKLSIQCKRTAFWLLLFSVLYIIGCHFHGGIGSRTLYIIYLFPPVFYMAGCYLGSKYRWDESALVFILFFVLFFYAVYDLLQILHFVFTNEGSVITSRAILDENGDITHGATGYAMIMSVLISGLAFIFTPKQKGLLKWIRVLGVILGILAVFGMASIVTRTSIVEAVVVLLFSIIMMLVEQNKQRHKTGFIIGAFVLLIGLYFLIKSSLLSDFIDAYQVRLENESYGYESAGGRSMRWLAGLKCLLSNPFGTPSGRIVGYGLNQSYAHNMWLDVGLRSGWFPFIILTIFSIRNVCHGFRLLKDKSYQYFTRLYFFSVFIIFILSCFVEPVLDGVYNHFLIYLVFCGIISEMKPKPSIIP